ncbi:MAG TPA: oxygenase MpaB family protein [Polyangiales bacterium]
MLGRDPFPTRAEYDAVVGALQYGDPAMDTLVDWMSWTPGARRMFQQAVDHGIETVPDAPEPLRAFFRIVDAEPAWLDRDLVEEGVDFIQRVGLAAPYVLRDVALMGGYLLSGFNHVLVMTGALNKDASLRIAETGQWWIECTERHGLSRFGTGFRSTLHVRLVHAMVRRGLTHSPKWDAEQWGVPVNQIDMVATYLGFCVVMLGGLRMLGIPVSAQESKAVMHLWAYAGWLMGVEERWLVFSERDGAVLLNHTLMTQSRPDWTSRELGRALSLEPLSRTYPRFSALRRKVAYYKHLSISRYFLGPEKMRQLGLPDYVPPLFPLATALPRALSHLGQGALPVLRARQRARGRAAQLQELTRMFGNSERRVGVHRDRVVAQQTEHALSA